MQSLDTVLDRVLSADAREAICARIAAEVERARASMRAEADAQFRENAARTMTQISACLERLTNAMDRAIDTRTTVATVATVATSTTEDDGGGGGDDHGGDAPMEEEEEEVVEEVEEMEEAEEAPPPPPPPPPRRRKTYDTGDEPRHPHRRTAAARPSKRRRRCGVRRGPPGQPRDTSRRTDGDDGSDSSGDSMLDFIVPDDAVDNEGGGGGDGTHPSWMRDSEDEDYNPNTEVDGASSSSSSSSTPSTVTADEEEEEREEEEEEEEEAMQGGDDDISDPSDYEGDVTDFMPWEQARRRACRVISAVTEKGRGGAAAAGRITELTIVARTGPRATPGPSPTEHPALASNTHAIHVDDFVDVMYLMRPTLSSTELTQYRGTVHITGFSVRPDVLSADPIDPSQCYVVGTWMYTAGDLCVELDATRASIEGAVGGPLPAMFGSTTRTKLPVESVVAVYAIAEAEQLLHGIDPDVLYDSPRSSMLYHGTSYRLHAEAEGEDANPERQPPPPPPPPPRDVDDHTSFEGMRLMPVSAAPPDVCGVDATDVEAWILSNFALGTRTADVVLGLLNAASRQASGLVHTRQRLVVLDAIRTLQCMRRNDTPHRAQMMVMNRHLIPVSGMQRSDETLYPPDALDAAVFLGCVDAVHQQYLTPDQFDERPRAGGNAGMSNVPICSICRRCIPEGNPVFAHLYRGSARRMANQCGSDGGGVRDLIDIAKEEDADEDDDEDDDGGGGGGVARVLFMHRTCAMRARAHINTILLVSNIRDMVSTYGSNIVNAVTDTPTMTSASKQQPPRRAGHARHTRPLNPDGVCTIIHKFFGASAIPTGMLRHVCFGEHRPFRAARPAIQVAHANPEIHARLKPCAQYTRQMTVMLMRTMLLFCSVSGPSMRCQSDAVEYAETPATCVAMWYARCPIASAG